MMTEAEWLVHTDPRAMLDYLGREASERKMRLFAVACCRCSRQLLRNKTWRDALAVSARYADGEATEEELRVAHDLVNGLASGPLYTARTEGEVRRWAEAVAVARAAAVSSRNYPMVVHAIDAAWNVHRAAHRDPNPRLVHLVRDVFGNPFRPVTFDERARTRVVTTLARGMYDEGEFRDLPILADAVEEARDRNAEVVRHLREPGPHVRGCWALDLVLGKT